MVRHKYTYRPFLSKSYNVTLRIQQQTNKNVLVLIPYAPAPTHRNM